jgi:class 3 adenylate cyclase
MQVPEEAQNRDVLLDVRSFLSNANIYENKKLHASILFADLVGSTEFKRYHNVREGLAKVVQHNEVVRECVDRFRGSVIKYLGDGVIAMFEGAKSEFRALEAGIETIRQMRVANEHQQWQYPFSMDTKIGIHSGPVWIFKYHDSPEDPQGTTVDIAARLSSLAGPNQVLCTKETYKIAQQAGGLPDPSAEFKRYLKGINDRFDLRVIMPKGYEYRPWDTESPSHEVRGKLEEAYRLLYEKKSKEAFNAFRRISEQHPDTYTANVFVAEYLLNDHAPTEQEYRDRLCKAEDHIDKAMCARPNSSHVWLLLGSLHFKHYEIEQDTIHIEKAIDCVRKAIPLARDWNNLGEFLQAKVCLLLFLQALVRERKDQGALDEANRLCIELEPIIEKAFDGCRSDFYVGYASVQLQSGSSDYKQIEEMIIRARELNPKNFRIGEVERDLGKRCSSNGGYAGMSSVSLFK